MWNRIALWPLLLVKCLEMVGEAALKLTRNFRDSHPEVAWRALIDLRNHLVHEYFDIDCERVWNTISSDIPAILPVLKQLVADLDPENLTP